MNPWTLVIWIVNLFWFPFSLVFRIINHRWLPFTIHFIIPVFRLTGIWIRNMLWLIPIFWLLVIRIINSCFVIPIARFLSFRILYFLRRKEVPVSFQLPRFHLIIINQNLISIVWLHNQCIEMCVDIIFAANIFVNKQIFALVTKYNMNFLCSWPTNVGSKHNFIRCFSMHIFWFQLAVKDFCISTTTVNVLFMFHSELNN